VVQQTASAKTEPPALTAELDRLSGLALAAGKDFNDELTFILNHAATLLQMLGAEHEASVALAELQDATLRCAEISRCLLLVTTRARDSFWCAKVKTGNAGPGD
jgi:hypothetical protein